MLQGEPIRPVTLKFAALDLLYMNNVDLTSRPLHQRRAALSTLISPHRRALFESKFVLSKKRQLEAVENRTIHRPPQACQTLLGCSAVPH